MKHNVNNFFQFQLSRVDDADSNNQNNYENPVLEMLLTANPEKFIVMLTLIHVNSETLWAIQRAPTHKTINSKSVDTFER